MDEFKVMLEIFKKETAGNSSMERTAWLMYYLMFNPLKEILNRIEVMDDRLRVIEDSVSE